MKNILSVDLEDHFCDLPFSQWEKYDTRIVKNTETLLNLFKKYNATATFFTLGHVAEHHPQLIEDIVKDGHEIASHGYYHRDLHTISQNDFEQELVKSIQILEKTSGDKIFGFRAPWFSISPENFWSFKILKKYLKYDSSIYPVGPHYGYASAPRNYYPFSLDDPLHINSNSDFFEIPLATLNLPGIGNFPIAGGIYLRFLPKYLLKFGIEKLNKKNFTAMCYIHPQDVDPFRPKLPGTSWHNYWGLKSAPKKLEYLLKNFIFTSAREILNL